ncbi:glycoside hydrolase [Tenacibaculum maritimum]|uniref:glycoside hydrolase family 113 n=2 Tax=Tenacibaculum maritimum TaxID=107401 RepID=UPI0012E61EFB|nr:glycoside hydrolase [Tenacibaculum maritimum]CAA0186671.1 Beta-1,4-mannanase, family GH113 [Tenacibaculum maritimum]CAA0215455.1 Beta-1,4-mannanase, family GH113 [Tenacibaculum maritimum]
MKAYQYIYFLVVIILLQGSCKSQKEKINGVSFVASSEAIHRNEIRPLRKASTNYVALMPFGFIKSLTSPEIIYNSNKQWFGETKEGVAQYASVFQKEGIKLMLKPQIWVWRGAFTGAIEMDTEEHWKLLESSYEKFILTYAELAASLKVNIFCIGTELEKFVVNRPLFWKALIRKIKRIYKGKLTYAANWDEFKRVPFWNELHYIGVDAYFPLSNHKSPTILQLKEGWKVHKEEVKKVQQQFNKKILFTEYGYRSIDFMAKEPWNSERIAGNVNLKNQVNALEVIHQQFWEEDWFAGGFLWKWFHNHHEVGGSNNNRFTPQNKPAEVKIKELYDK